MAENAKFKCRETFKNFDVLADVSVEKSIVSETTTKVSNFMKIS